MLCALVPLAGAVFDTSGDTYLESVAMVSPSDGWAVGSFYYTVGGLRGVIWHYHNGQWAPIPSPTTSGLRGVTALPDGEAWAVGYGGTILHERGGGWTQAANGTTDDLYSVAMASPDEGWAVGGNYQLPTALHSSQPFAAEAAPALHSSLNGLRLAVIVQPNLSITCRILHYLRGRWSPVSCPLDEPLYSVAVLPDGEAWAVGQQGIAHEQQGVWKQVPSPDKYLASVALVSSTEGWAVGARGIILHEQDGVWSLAPQVTSASLDGVAVSSTGQGWIVGGSDLLQLSQGAWQPVASPKEVPPYDSPFAVSLLPGGLEPLFLSGFGFRITDLAARSLIGSSDDGIAPLSLRVVPARSPESGA